MDGLRLNKNRISDKDKKDIGFILLVVAAPVLQFLIFYVYVNFNTLIMAFEKYSVDESSGLGFYSLNGFENFSRAFTELFSPNMLAALKNSCVYYLVSVAVGIPFALIFSFYVYKKRAFSGFFKVMLFLPSIISAIVLIIMFKHFANYGIPELVKDIFGVEIGSLINTESSAFGTVLFYAVWFNFGGGVLIYLGTMNSISDSLVEAAELDGATTFQEFFHVTLPMIYPTVSTFIITSLAALFTADMGLYSFYSFSAPYSVQTMGYWLLKETRAASFAGYPYLCALGIIFTLVTVPLTVVIRRLLNKCGPSAE